MGIFFLNIDPLEYSLYKIFLQGKALLKAGNRKKSRETNTIIMYHLE